MVLISKRVMVLAGLAILVLFGFSSHNAVEAKETTVPPALYIDGKPVDYKKLKVKNRVENMISLSTVTTKLKMKLEWVTKNKEWILSNADHTIRMKLDSTAVSVDSKQQKIITPAFKDNGSIYLPLRFIVVSSGGELHNHSGINVYWVLSANQNALASAIMSNKVEEVKSGLKHWKEATIPLGLDGTMPYIYAVESIEMVELLLEKGFPIDYQENEYENILLPGGRTTLLHQAAIYGKHDLVKYLLDRGADPNLKSSIGESNALDFAIWGREQVGGEIYELLGHDATVEDFDRIIELLKESMEQEEKRT